MSNARPKLRTTGGTAARDARRLILVGIDGSEAANNALEWSIGLAHDIGGELVVVHALDTELVAYLTQHLKGRFRVDEWEAEQRQAFDEEWSAPLAKSSVPSRQIIVQGRPANVIQEAAERLDAELVVVGRHGHRMVTRMLLGSVADELVHHCPRPVVVFPRPEAVQEFDETEVHLEIKR